ncbi:MAG: glycosyltransferase [Myxococcota bacterium]
MSAIGSGARVLVVGPGGAGAMAISVAHGFAALGCEVRHVHWGRFAVAVGALALPGRNRLAMAGHHLARPFEAAFVVDEARRFRPDLVFFLKCDDLPPLVYRALAMLRPRPVLAVFHPDDPFNVGRGLWRRVGGPSDVRAIDQMRAVDDYFVWSHALVDGVRAAGAKAAHYLPFACDPELHPRPDESEVPAELRAAVAFIGNWDPERERWLAALAATDVDLAVWGTPDWLRRCQTEAIRARYRGRVLMAREMALATRGSALNLNVLRRQNKGATNMRTFEIPCAGGFLLHERSPEAAAIFEPGVAMDDFATPEELAAKVAHWLARPDERAAIAERGFAVARRHTYREWAAQVVATCLGR